MDKLHSSHKLLIYTRTHFVNLVAKAYTDGSDGQFHQPSTARGSQRIRVSLGFGAQGKFSWLWRI